MHLRRLVVGVDGSAPSRAALEWAVGLARATGAEVAAVHAVGLLEDIGEDTPVPTASHLDEIRERFEQLADDIFCLDDGPRILDCLEFDDRLRHLDCLADVASLVADLVRLGRADLGTRLLGTYARAAADDWPTSLADHWIAYATPRS